MNHKYRQTWLSPDLDGFRCSNCGYETVDPEDISVPCRDRNKYWYMFYETECVICGKYLIEKERKYYPKPEEYYDRHRCHEHVCSDHYEWSNF